MDILNLDRFYQSFLRTHRSQITILLKEEFQRFLRIHQDTIVKDSDFAIYVGTPLFVLGLIWIGSGSSLNDWLIIILTIAVGFCIKYFHKQVVAIACKEFFRDRRVDVVTRYVENCWSDALTQLEGKDASEINEYFSFCRRMIISEHFQYWR